MKFARLSGLIASIAIAGAVASTDAQAQSAWRPTGPVELIVGTGPGSGFDRLARDFQRVAGDLGLLDFTTTVVNKPGGNTTIGFSYLNQHEGDANFIAVMSPVLLTNEIVGNAPLGYTDLTPLAILVGEEIVLAVNADSPITSGTDFVERLKADPTSISIGLSGVGGQNHLTVALVAQAGGADISQLKIVGFDGSSDALTAVLGGHVDVLAAPVSTVAPQLEAGTMRVLGVASENRLAGAFADVPTWKEQGIDAVFSNWRGFVAPGGTPPEQVAFWDDIFGRLSQSQEWKDAVAAAGLSAVAMNSAEATAFLASEHEKLAGVLRALGMIQQ